MSRPPSGLALVRMLTDRCVSAQAGSFHFRCYIQVKGNGRIRRA